MRIALVVMILVCLVAAHRADARTAHPARYVKVWICPERPDGTSVVSRSLCVIERWARW